MTQQRYNAKLRSEPTYEGFKNLLDQSGEYGEEVHDYLEEYAADNPEEVRTDIIRQLEEDPGSPERQTQLMALLSAEERKKCGGESIEEDCRVDEQNYSA